MNGVTVESNIIETVVAVNNIPNPQITAIDFPYTDAFENDTLQVNPDMLTLEADGATINTAEFIENPAYQFINAMLNEITFNPVETDISITIGVRIVTDNPTESDTIYIEDFPVKNYIPDFIENTSAYSCNFI